MATSTEWQQPEPYRYTAGLEDPDWAWEFLRRNPEYQMDFARLQETRERFGDAAAVMLELEIGQRWGLRFCREPGRPRRRQ